MNGEKLKIPLHVAIIPDGNRRWAREKGFEAVFGHKKSAEYEHIKSLIDEAKKLGVKYISLWAFSTENWKRDKAEIETLFNLAHDFIKKYRAEAMKEGVRFRHIGRKDRIPKELASEIGKLEKETEGNSAIGVQLLLDYGGRDEMIRTFNKLLKKGANEINEKTILDNLDTAGIPEPDLVIRTSGEMRTSGLMPFQSAYAELYFCKKHFPDFGAKDLRKAVKEFGNRERRFGGNPQ